MKQIQWELKFGILALTMDGNTLLVKDPQHQTAIFARIQDMEAKWNWQCESLMNDARSMITGRLRNASTVNR